MIIVSITGPTTEGSLGQIRRSRKFASIFEFRLDLMGIDALDRLIKSAKRPVLATCRPTWEGGGFSGSDDERMAILRQAIRFGATYVDLELRMGARFLRRFIDENPDVHVVASRHSFDDRIPDPGREYRALRSTGAHVLKLAYRANDAGDIVAAFEFLARAKRDRQRAVAIAMGEAGEASRILYRKFGGWAMYASPLDGPAAAEGQIRADMLHSLFRADRLKGSTRIYGVIGDPVRYSKGIYMHNPLFHRAGKDAVYCRFTVKDLPGFMRKVGPDLHGISVTLPHKRAIMKHLDRIDDASRAIGAVNTVIRRGTRLLGSNTDGAGALDAIERKMKVKGKTFLIIGAGGAARAIAVEAVRRGAVVFITNRTPETAQELARRSGARVVTIPELSSCDIVANATSVGMAPAVDVTPLPAGTVRMRLAFDAVYQPAETRFLREAREQGAMIVPGIEMYLNQAAAQSRLYTGIQPDLKWMHRMLDNVLLS